jgi:hypothetical protein
MEETITRNSTIRFLPHCHRSNLNCQKKAQSSHYWNNDPSIFEDADEDNQQNFDAFIYTSTLDKQALFVTSINREDMTNNFGNYAHKRGPSENNTFDSLLIADNKNSWRDSNQSLAAINCRRSMTNKACKALAQQLAGNPEFSIIPVAAKKTNTSMTPVTSLISAMSSTDICKVTSRSFDMKVTSATTETNQLMHETHFPHTFVSSIENKMVNIVSAPLSICDTNSSKNLECCTISSLEKINSDTFVRETDITDADILSGRGGKSNHHIGNKRFRHLVSEMKSMYQSKGTRTDKTALSKAVIEFVHSYDGRFLIQEEKDNDRVWRVMTTMEAQRKTSQALRETKILKWTQTLPDFMPCRNL